MATDLDSLKMSMLKKYIKKNSQCQKKLKRTGTVVVARHQREDNQMWYDTLTEP